MNEFKDQLDKTEKEKVEKLIGELLETAAYSSLTIYIQCFNTYVCDEDLHMYLGMELYIVLTVIIVLNHMG
jgi:hypothetical protein